MGDAQTNFIERRLFTRRVTSARVKLVHGAIGELNARTRDISDSGVFVLIDPVPRLPAGSHIKMHMLDSKVPALAFNMKVVRITSDGLGLKFIDFEVDGERYSIDSLREQFRNKK